MKTKAEIKDIKEVFRLSTSINPNAVLITCKAPKYRKFKNEDDYLNWLIENNKISILRRVK